MSNPQNPEGSAPEPASGASTERKGVGCLAITLMALLCIGAMLALIALIGDPT